MDPYEIPIYTIPRRHKASPIWQESDGISIVYPFMLLANRYLPIPVQL